VESETINATIFSDDPSAAKCRCLIRRGLRRRRRFSPVSELPIGVLAREFQSAPWLWESEILAALDFLENPGVKSYKKLTTRNALTILFSLIDVNFTSDLRSNRYTYEYRNQCFLTLLDLWNNISIRKLIWVRRWKTNQDDPTEN